MPDIYDFTARAADGINTAAALKARLEAQLGAWLARQHS